MDTTESSAHRPSFLTPLLQLLRGGQRSVPAVKYAYGVVGVAAAAALVNLVLGHSRLSVILLVLTFAGMILLFLFAKMVALGVSPSIRAAISAIVWVIVVTFAATLFVMFTAFVARWPQSVVDYLFPAAEASTTDLLQRVVAPEEIADAQDAITELSARCERGCDDSTRIIRTLTTALNNTDHFTRDLNVGILRLLRKLTKDDLRSVLRKEFEDRELVEVDLSNTNLSGVSLRGAFLILSEMRNADLSKADLSESRLRSTNLRGAKLDGASLSKADWFNSYGLDVEQFRQIAGPILKCPSQYVDPSFAPFIAGVNSRYPMQYENYSSAMQQALKDQWETYAAPGGLCQLADERK